MRQNDQFGSAAGNCSALTCCAGAGGPGAEGLNAAVEAPVAARRWTLAIIEAI